jgi:hypothetical protein
MLQVGATISPSTIVSILYKTNTFEAKRRGPSCQLRHYEEVCFHGGISLGLFDPEDGGKIFIRNIIFFIYLLQLGLHPVTVVLP